MLGAMASRPTSPSSSVWPSGAAAFATSCAAGPGLAQPFGEEARDDIRPAARREAQHDSHRPLGKGGGGARPGRRERGARDGVTARDRAEPHGRNSPALPGGIAAADARLRAARADAPVCPGATRRRGSAFSLPPDEPGPRITPGRKPVRGVALVVEAGDAGHPLGRGFPPGPGWRHAFPPLLRTPLRHHAEQPSSIPECYWGTSQS